MKPVLDTTPAGWPLAEFLPDAHVNFLHIGKCAGTSVRLLVQSCFSASETLQHILGEHRYLTTRKLEGAFGRDYVGKFSSSHVGSMIFELTTAPLNVFTWLRDPLETAFSTIYFIAQHAAISGEVLSREFYIVKDIVDSSKSPFEVFLKVVELFANQPIHAFQPSRPLSFVLARSARRRDLPYPETVRASIDALHKCFFIGLLEEQHQSLEMLSRFLPLRCPARTFRANSTLVRPDTARGLTPDQTEEARAILAGEYEIYNEGKRLWNLQREALRAEGWIDLPPEERACRSFRRLYSGLLDCGRWTAGDAAFAEGLHDVEFEDDSGGRVFWRWTSPGDRAAIRLPVRPGRTIKLTVEISRITPPPQLEAIGIEIDGRRLPLRYMGRSEHGFLFETILHKERLPKDGVDVGILNARPFRASATDPRQLGVAVLSITWKPVPPPDHLRGN